MYDYNQNVTRGDFLFSNSKKRTYALVRSGDPKTTTAGVMYGFNLLNMETGKMRTTDADRTLYAPGPKSVALRDLRRHYTDLDLVALPAAMSDVAGKVKSAIADTIEPPQVIKDAANALRGQARVHKVVPYTAVQPRFQVVCI